MPALRTAAARVRHVETAVVLVGGLALVALLDPHRAGRFPPCPWHALTGTWCPGCGGLRATFDLVHGHLAAAAGENLMVVLAALVAPLWLWRRRTATAPAAGRGAGTAGRRPAVALAAAVVTFTVLRNLPFAAALAP